MSGSNMESLPSSHTVSGNLINLQDLEIQVLNALDNLRKTDYAAKHDGPVRNLELVEQIPRLRLRCQIAERGYTTALEELGFSAAFQELNCDAVELYSSETKSTHNAHEDLASSDFARRIDGREHAPESATVTHAQAEHLMTNQDWCCEREKLETLMRSLRATETQNPLLLLRLRAEGEKLFTSMMHQRIQWGVENSKILAKYNDCLHRLAKLSVEMDVLHIQIDQIHANTDLDLRATAAVRADIARRTHGLIESPPPISTTHLKRTS